MHRLARVAAVAAATLLAAGTPGAALAQPTMSVACAPGVGCSQLRFTIATTDAILLNSLTLGINGGTWRFLEPVTPGIGTYGALDDLGPFGGFTTISDGGSELFINFLDNGFSFELGAGSTGFVQVEGTSSDPGGIIFDYSGELDGGERFGGRVSIGDVPPPSVVPEPATVLLLGTGLAGVAVVARRRRGATV